MEEIVVFTVTMYSKDGKSIFNNLCELNKKTFTQFVPSEDSVRKTIYSLKSRGMSIEASSEVGITCSCNKVHFEDVFATKVIKSKVKGIQEGEYFTYETENAIEIPSWLECVEKITMPKQMFVLDERIQPQLPYFHYTLPKGIQQVAKKKLFDKCMFERTECKVGIIDTGLYHHEFFKQNGYEFSVDSAVSFFDCNKDEKGHGTGMSAVLLALLDKSKITMIKASNLNWSYPVAALQQASKYNFDVLNCSWGFIGFEPQAYLEIANLINKNTIVVFSCGNGATDRKKSFLQTVAYPDVISVGGCMVHMDGTIEVSDISSSYDSDLFKNRHVPDLCGICGKLPYAQIILMPIQPAALFDFENGKRDETEQDDGWFVSSGTSAAAAYVSGIITNILETGLIQKEEISDFLVHSCKKVREGKNFMGEVASGREFDLATGSGFLDFESVLDNLHSYKLKGDINEV